MYLVLASKIVKLRQLANSLKKLPLLHILHNFGTFVLTIHNGWAPSH
jgi:hypothetical protein